MRGGACHASAAHLGSQLPLPFLLQLLERSTRRRLRRLLLVDGGEDIRTELCTDTAEHATLLQRRSDDAHQW